jgi:mRNA interferase MazF
MADPIRGEIWLADLGTGRGHEQTGHRPVLVVSEDTFNAGPAGLVIVLPLTSKVAKSKNIPAHVRVDPPEGGLKTPSLILCDQLRTVSKDRLGKAPWGMLTAATLAKVDTAVRVLLGL